MPAVFFARIANRIYGPFDADKLKKLATAGKITRDDAVSRDGKTGWTLAGNVKGIFPPAELLVPDSPRPIETVIRREPSALARPATMPAVPIPQAIPAPPTIVYMHAPAAPAPQQNVQTTVIVNAARPHNTCATLAAGLGLLSLIAAFVPVLGLIVLPAAGLTLLLAIFGFILALTRGGTGLVGSLGGGLLAVIAIPIALTSTVAGVGGAIQAVEQARQQARQTAEQEAPAAAESQPAGAATIAPASAVAPGSEESPKENPGESEAANSLERERAKLAGLEAELESNRQKIEISRANHAKVERDLANRVEMGKRKPDDLLRAKTHTEEFEQRSARLLAKLTADVAAQKQIVARAGGDVAP